MFKTTNWVNFALLFFLAVVNGCAEDDALDDTDAGGDADTDTDTDMDADTDTDGECQGEVTFPDANLNAAVREALGVSSDHVITADDLKGITAFEANEMEISELTGMECMKSLTELSLQVNNISDISPLGGLTSMSHLALSHS